MENNHAASSPPFAKKTGDFSGLSAWKYARKLRQGIYGAASHLPVDEKHRLAGQLKRAAISVTANLAQGYGRYCDPESVQFCRQGRSSRYELRDHLTTALDAGYIGQENMKSSAPSSPVNGCSGAARNLKAAAEK